MTSGVASDDPLSQASPLAVDACTQKKINENNRRVSALYYYYCTLRYDLRATSIRFSVDWIRHGTDTRVPLSFDEKSFFVRSSLENRIVTKSVFGCRTVENGPNVEDIL